MALEREDRHFLLKVLGSEATDLDWERFSERPDSKRIAGWMQTLPAFRRGQDAYDDDLDDEDPGDGNL